MRRLPALLLVVAVLVSCSSTTVACDERQTNTYITQILFGDSALSQTSNDKVLMLLNALYLCSEQSDGRGKEKLDFLKEKNVLFLPSLSDIDIESGDLFACAHNSWEHIYSLNQKCQINRKKVLQNTVNKVFDFGVYNNMFGSGGGKCNSFAALLYYAHILADYLADSPDDTATVVNGKEVFSYSGQPYYTLNGNSPLFTRDQKKSTNSFINYSSLDSIGRAGVVIANIGPEIINSVGDRKNMTGIKPSGWSFNRYPEIVNTQPPYVFNRCHLLAHALGGDELEINLITGTRYLNEAGMSTFEKDVVNYIKKTNNHVLYRVTPVFKGDNKLCSGVQIEAYSIEDEGAGICFNKYFYNVQPGIELNYVTGDNELADKTLGADNILPFVRYNPNEQNPDLTYEINKHLGLLFNDQKNSGTYGSLTNQLNMIASEARSVGSHGESAAQQYLSLKEYEYKYFNVLKIYLPLLLAKESFFKSAFRQF